MEKHIYTFLRLSLALIYLWFGGLKFFDGLSPAHDLAIQTIDALTFELIPGNISIKILAIWEVSLGLLFAINKYKKIALIGFFTHMLCTFTPLFFLPDLSFQNPPLVFTLVGQYIVKNLVFIGVGALLWRNA